jgi:hypothetical protein
MRVIKTTTEAGHRLNSSFLNKFFNLSEEVLTMAMPVQHNKLLEAVKVISEQQAGQPLYIN